MKTTLRQIPKDSEEAKAYTAVTLAIVAKEEPSVIRDMESNMEGKDAVWLTNKHVSSGRVSFRLARPSNEVRILKLHGCKTFGKKPKLSGGLPSGRSRKQGAAGVTQNGSSSPVVPAPMQKK